jgi:hypothetical protein
MDQITDTSEKRRKFELDNGSILIASCINDPYGFWRLHWEKGDTPSALLSGSFTSFAEAQKAVTRYCNEENRKVVVLTTNRKTSYETGMAFADRYNPPELKLKKVNTKVPLDTR